MTDHPPPRTCILVDLENYSSLEGVQQEVAQQALADALTSAAGRAGLTRLRWERQPSGDGELAILPAEERLTEAVGAFPVALAAELREQHRRTELHLRVRMSMVRGRVTEAALGYADHAVVEAARIVDAPPVRLALTSAKDAYLVLALSAELYRDVVKHGGAALTADRFRRVPIDRIEGDAWVTIPGVAPDLLVTELAPETTAPAVTDAPIATLKMDGVQGSGYQTVINGMSTSDFHIGPRHG